jgi:hypothetical protein
MSNVASERVVNGIKTRVLHGKDYVEVAERVRIAHSGDIQFEQVSTEQFSIESRWFVRCVILVNNKHFIGTAEIKFTAPKNTPDGTNPMECAETSALGRALAFAGLGTVESIASFDEVYRVESIEEAEMSGRPVVEAAKPRQITALAPAPEDDTQEQAIIERFTQVKALFLTLFKPDRWEPYKVHRLGMPVADEHLSLAHLDKLYVSLMDAKQQKAS